MEVSAVAALYIDLVGGTGVRTSGYTDSHDILTRVPGDYSCSPGHNVPSVRKCPGCDPGAQLL